MQSNYTGKATTAHRAFGLPASALPSGEIGVSNGAGIFWAACDLVWTPVAWGRPSVRARSLDVRRHDLTGEVQRRLPRRPPVFLRTPCVCWVRKCPLPAGGFAGVRVPSGRLPVPAG